MKSKLPYLLALTGGALVALTLSPLPSRGELGASDEAVGVLVSDLIVQQTKITENHGKIDEKIAAIAEEVRQARIFAKRGK